MLFGVWQTTVILILKWRLTQGKPLKRLRGIAWVALITRLKPGVNKNSADGCAAGSTSATESYEYQP